MPPSILILCQYNWFIQVLSSYQRLLFSSNLYKEMNRGKHCLFCSTLNGAVSEGNCLPLCRIIINQKNHCLDWISLPQFLCPRHPNHCHLLHKAFGYHFDKISAHELVGYFQALVCSLRLKPNIKISRWSGTRRWIWDRVMGS